MRGIHNPFDVPFNIAENLKDIYERLCNSIGYEEKDEEEIEEAKEKGKKQK